MQNPDNISVYHDYVRDECMKYKGVNRDDIRSFSIKFEAAKVFAKQ
jgi:hypothetical protein